MLLTCFALWHCFDKFRMEQTRLIISCYFLSNRASVAQPHKWKHFLKPKWLVVSIIEIRNAVLRPWGPSHLLQKDAKHVVEAKQAPQWRWVPWLACARVDGPGQTLTQASGLTFPLTFFPPIFLHRLLAFLSETRNELLLCIKALTSLRWSSNLDWTTDWNAE